MDSQQSNERRKSLRPRREKTSYKHCIQSTKHKQYLSVRTRRIEKKRMHRVEAKEQETKRQSAAIKRKANHKKVGRKKKAKSKRLKRPTKSHSAAAQRTATPRRAPETDPSTPQRTWTELCDVVTVEADALRLKSKKEALSLKEIDLFERNRILAMFYNLRADGYSAEMAYLKSVCGRFNSV